MNTNIIQRNNMKYQVRKSVLTFLYEVQQQEVGTSVWRTRAKFKTKDEADRFLQTLVKAETKNEPKAPKQKKERRVSKK